MIAQWVRHFAAGMLMGAADIVPGVSGGTMALITGVYERLVESIDAGFRAVVAMGRGNLAEARLQFARVSWSLVLPLGVGIALAIIVGAIVITSAIERFPLQSHALFLGLVAASIAIPWRRMQQRDAASVGLMFSFGVLAFYFTGLAGGVPVEAPSLVRVFLSASLAICAMILPGISGAFLLKAMGMYEPTLMALRELELAYVGTFILGAAIGIGMFSRLLTYLLHTHHDLTMAALVGLMAGSLRALWPWQERLVAQSPETGTLLVSLWIIIGLGLIMGVLLWENRLKAARKH